MQGKEKVEIIVDLSTNKDDLWKEVRIKSHTNIKLSVFLLVVGSIHAHTRPSVYIPISGVLIRTSVSDLKLR